MNIYTLTVALHVIIAVLGVGQLTALGVVAARENAAPDAAKVALRTLGNLTTGVTGSLVAMLVTGLAAEWLSGWAYHGTWWFRIAFLLFLLVGACAGGVRKTLRGGDADPGKALARIRALAGIMVGLTAVIVALMQLTPL